MTKKSKLRKRESKKPKVKKIKTVMKANKKKKRIQRNKCSKKSTITFGEFIKRIKNHIVQQQPKTFKTALSVALKKASNIKKQIKPTRVIPVPKVGGFLPLIPLFAGLSALGALSGGAAGIAKAVNDAKSARQELEESKRHNRTMESIALGKGLYLKPYKTGLGLFLRPAPDLRVFR